MVDELTELIRTAGTPAFEAREQDALNRVHQDYFAAVADLSLSTRRAQASETAD